MGPFLILKISKFLGKGCEDEAEEKREPQGGSATASLPCDLTAAPKSGRQQLPAAVTGQGGSRTRWKGDHVAFLLFVQTGLKSLT